MSKRIFFILVALCISHSKFFSVYFSILARLDKADRALCFTSGMAALAVVTHLIAPGASSIFHLFLLCT